MKKNKIKCVVFDFLGVIYPDNIKSAKVLIDKLKKQGIMVAAITSLNRQIAEKICDFVGIDINKLIVASELKIKKSDSRLYNYFLKINNLNGSEVLFIDDNFNNLIAAKKNGIITVLFNSVDLMADYNVRLWSELELKIRKMIKIKT